MTKYSAGTLAIVLFIFVCCYFGCSSNDHVIPREPSRPPTTFAAKPTALLENLTPEELFGTFIVTDCAPWRGLQTEFGADADAKASIGKLMIISKDLYSYNGIISHKPRYIVRHYPQLAEGEVPNAEYRSLMDFWGFGSQRDDVVRLEIRDLDGSQHQPLEVIDRDTLWYPSGWLLQLKRVGTEKNYLPLKRDF